MPGSNSFLLVILLITIGRKKAKSTEDAVCIPRVPLKISMQNPIANDENNNNQPGTSNGRRSIK
jgi:hypothetical protein